MQKSQDELHHNQELFNRLKVEPGKHAVSMIEAAITIVMQSLGVDYSKDIKLQQTMLGIHLVDSGEITKAWIGVDEVMTPQLQGYYIFQEMDDTLVPVAVVGNAYVNKDGKISVPILWVRENLQQIIVGRKIETE